MRTIANNENQVKIRYQVIVLNVGRICATTVRLYALWMYREGNRMMTCHFIEEQMTLLYKQCILYINFEKQRYWKKIIFIVK